MTRISVLVADDESGARRNLTALLRPDPDIGEIIECDSGQKTIEQLRTSSCDLLFLDVQMPGCDGFDVLEMLGGELPPAVIFVTAYDEYALRAFEAGALDYLLKPFDDARFRRALERAKDKLVHFSPRPKIAKRLAVKTRGELVFLSVADVDWIESAAYYACLHIGKSTHVLRRTLLELERDLDAEKFMRIHRSIIVNLKRIHKLELQDGGDYEVVLQSGDRLRLSRRFRKPLLDRLNSLSEGD
jgi:two-component system, LytTR family, response regulator